MPRNLLVVFATLWSLFSVLWSDTGSGLDPDGLTDDTGPWLDPNG